MFRNSVSVGYFRFVYVLIMFRYNQFEWLLSCVDLSISCHFACATIQWSMNIFVLLPWCIQVWPYLGQLAACLSLWMPGFDSTPVQMEFFERYCEDSFAEYNRFPVSVILSVLSAQISFIYRWRHTIQRLRASLNNTPRLVTCSFKMEYGALSHGCQLNWPQCVVVTAII